MEIKNKDRKNLKKPKNSQESSLKINLKNNEEIDYSNLSKEKNLALNKNKFPIVGIGASAGGLEAIEKFFRNTPKETGMAFVIIQHLDPTHTGMMPELLQRMTQMKVLQVTDGLRVEPDKVYVIPPNKNMSILEDKLYLFEPVESRGFRLPIDFFFRSLANEKREKSIGIILSGMGSDGSQGLKSIKEKNGLVLVQEPSTAKFDSMPRSATKEVVVDVVAPVEELPMKLIEFINFSPVNKKDSNEIIENKSNLEKIIILIREQTGHDFYFYKKNTLFRRIERRKNIHQIKKIEEYIRLLQENPKEVEILSKELLIGVTNFFRDSEVWETLKNEVLPDLIKKSPKGHVIRAWVTACSTGEEAYSLAIIFREILEKEFANKNITLQIFATDVDGDAIDKARKGVFLPNITNDVTPERIAKFFIADGENYRVNSSIREMVVFAPHDVIRDAPFNRIDIITCRNLLIYMEPELQKRLITLFNYCLNPGGIMLLGTAETIANNNEGFEALHNKLKIFKHTSRISATEIFDFPSSFYKNKKIVHENKVPGKKVENIQGLAEQILLQKYSPASVLINENGDIIYITGRTGKYLEPVAGKANWNIYAMAREGLRKELPKAIRKAKQNYKELRLHNIKIGTNGDGQYIDIVVQRIESPRLLKDLIVIVFIDLPIGDDICLDNKKDVKQGLTPKDDKLEREVRRLENELEIQLEDMKTSQEELKTTNEELQSTNEELQSTNEELTTSKEETQSLNEELQTVNIELQSKVNDYVQTNNDMKNLLNSTEVAILFLDKDLNIRRFTESLMDIFKLRSSDIGRPFTDIANHLKYSEMSSHSENVLRTLVSREMAIATDDGRWFNVRIMPYRTMDDRIDGVVITFSNITVYKNLENELEKLNEKCGLKDKKEEK
jgi:two-component system CheB/CheR fusion protein